MVYNLHERVKVDLKKYRVAVFLEFKEMVRAEPYPNEIGDMHKRFCL